MLQIMLLKVHLLDVANIVQFKNTQYPINTICLESVLVSPPNWSNYIFTTT